MELFSAACTLGLAADHLYARRDEFNTPDIIAPFRITKPRSTALQYFCSTRRNVARPTPTETYAIIAARMGQGNSCAMKTAIPLITTTEKIIGVQTAKPIRAPIAL